VLNVILILFIGNMFRFLVVGFIMLILGSALKVRKKEKLSIEVEDALLIEAKTECERVEGEQFQKDFMVSLKKTLGEQSSPSILKEAYFLSQNGRCDNWRRKAKKK